MTNQSTNSVNHFRHESNNNNKKKVYGYKPIILGLKTKSKNLQHNYNKNKQQFEKFKPLNM